MSMDGAQAHNNTDHTPHEIVDFLKQGIHNDQLSEHTTHVDDVLAGSQLSHSNKVDLSKAVGELLSQEGLLPRATSEFSQDNFESLSNGDKNITALDLDNVINAGLEGTSPVKGMFARTLRNNIESIAMAHQDAYRQDDPRVDREVAKGISMKDLQKWGEKISDTKFHTAMSRGMIANFGLTEKWTGLAGSDNLLSKSELEAAQLDTIRYDSDERASLNYMRENFGDIKSSRSGDSTWNMSLSDVHDWSAKFGVKLDQSQALSPKAVEAAIDPENLVGSATGLGLNSIARGLQDGNLTSQLRQFDSVLMQNNLDAGQISNVNANIASELEANNLMNRVMGQYAAENFDQMKGDNKYIHSSELDTILLSAGSRNHPTETMIVGLLKERSDMMALAHDDVTNNKSDSAEQSRGISLKDATKFRDAEIEVRQHKDMSANMLGFFGTEEEFMRLAGGINDISDEAFGDLKHGHMTKEDFDEAFNVSKDELEEAREDHVRFNEAERNTIHYMRENYGDIKSATSGDGRRITLSDLIKHAENNGITMEMVRPNDHQLAQAESNHSHVPAEKQSEDVQRAGDAEESRWTKPADAKGQTWGKQVDKPADRQQDKPSGLQDLMRQNERQDRSRASDARIGGPNEITKIKVKNGETIWDIAKQKYGTHAIEAVFEANGMVPSVGRTKEGQPVLIDPEYKAGDELILPAAEHLGQLTDRYRQRADHLREQFSSRVGHPEHCAEIQLMYGDTLSKLAEQKYGRPVSVLALYEANQLPPRWVRNEQGALTPLEPIYYAGHTYILPPAKDLAALEQAYIRKHFRR